MENGQCLGCPFVRAASCRAHHHALRTWLQGCTDPVLLQDASVLKSIKGISKQITW